MEKGGFFKNGSLHKNKTDQWSNFGNCAILTFGQFWGITFIEMTKGQKMIAKKG